MTTSPYDNLPVSRKSSADSTLEHIPRFRNMHNSGEGSGTTFSNAGDAVMQPADKDLTAKTVHQDKHTKTGCTSSSPFSSMQNQGCASSDVEGNISVRNYESRAASESQHLAHDMNNPSQQAANKHSDPQVSDSHAKASDASSHSNDLQTAGHRSSRTVESHSSSTSQPGENQGSTLHSALETTDSHANGSNTISHSSDKQTAGSHSALTSNPSNDNIPQSIDTHSSTPYSASHAADSHTDTHNSASQTADSRNFMQAAGQDYNYHSLTDEDSDSDRIENLTYVEVDPEEYENTASRYRSAMPAATSNEAYAEILHDGMDNADLSESKGDAPYSESVLGSAHPSEPSPVREPAARSVQSSSEPGTAAAADHSSGAGSESEFISDYKSDSDSGSYPASQGIADSMPGYVSIDVPETALASERKSDSAAHRLVFSAAAHGFDSDFELAAASGHSSGSVPESDYKSAPAAGHSSAAPESGSTGIPASASGSAASSFSSASPHNINTMQNHSLEQHIPMENAPSSNRLTVKNMIGTSETTIESEETLLVPDTMPDMERILFSECTVFTSKPQGSRYNSDDTVSGTITIYTIYKPAPPSDTPIDVIRSSIPFQTSKPPESNTFNKPNTSNKPAADIKATYFIPVVTARECTSDMINERKFTAKVSLLLQCSEIAETEIPILRNSDDEDLETLRKTITVSSLSFETDDRTEISQEINIRDGSPAPKKILSTIIHITENHKQITSGKLVINATIHTKVLYAGEADGETTICELSSKTDFTQFTAIDRECSCENITTTFDSSNLTITIADDDRFLLEGHVLTFLRGYEAKELPMICDAYHKKRDIIFDRHEQLLFAASDSVSGEISSREIINPEETSRKPERLIYGSCRPASLTATPEKNRIIIEGSVHAIILSLDSTGEPFIIQRDIPIRGSLEMAAQPQIPPEHCSTESITADITSDIRSFWFDEINNRQLEINVTINVNISINIPVTFISMENFAFAETNPAVNHVSMALYITGSDDTLWDIAKRYRTDTNSIAETNNISEEQPLPPGTKLLIVK